MALLARTAAARRRGRLSTRQAIVLGLIQGPAEVMPVSSSGHLVLVPELMGWPYARLPADVRKTFEVALHAGAGLALAWLLRDDVVAAASDPFGTALLTAPAAAVALALEDQIERRASGPRIAAVGMIAGGIALAAAEGRTPKGVRPPAPEAGRSAEGVRPLGSEAACSPGGVRPLGSGAGCSAAGGRPLLRMREFVVGLSQAVALVPGVSRNGATLTAARALGFDPEAAARISWRAGLPIIGGATALKIVRLRQRGLARDLRAPFASGAAAAFASTLVASPLLRLRGHRLTAAYRVALGAFALRRLHRLEWPRG